MTITNDDPEITFGGMDDPLPSAPTASMIDNNLPTATAIGSPLVSSPATTLSSDGNIERIFNDDGSLSIKITTTTPQPNGYREVQIEYFHIPLNMVDSVSLSLDAGNKPSNLYLTKMENQILPPGIGEVISSPPVVPTVTATTATTSTPIQHQEPVNNTPIPTATTTVQQQQSMSNECCKSCGLCCGVFCLVFIIIVIISAAVGSTHSSSNSYTPPSYSPPSPSWHNNPTWHDNNPTPSSWHYPTPSIWHNHPSIHYRSSSPTSSSRPTHWFYNDNSPHWDNRQPTSPPHWGNSLSTSAPTVSSQPTISPRPTYSPATISPALSPLFPPSSGSSSSRTQDHPTTPSGTSSEHNKMKIASSPIYYDSISTVESDRKLEELRDKKKVV